MGITWFTHFLLGILAFMSTNFEPTTALNVRHKRNANPLSMAMLRNTLSEIENDPNERFIFSRRERKNNFKNDPDGVDSNVQLYPIRKFYLNLRDGLESPIAYVYDEDIEGPGSPPTATVLAVSNPHDGRSSDERKMKKRAQQADDDVDLPIQVDHFLDKLKELKEEKKGETKLNVDDGTAPLTNLRNVFREAVDEAVSQQPQKISDDVHDSKLLLHYLKQALESKNVVKKQKRFSTPQGTKDSSLSEEDLNGGKMMNVVEKNGFVLLEKESFVNLIRRANLIDKENSYLTKALTAATMSQNAERNSESDFRLLALELQELQKAANLRKDILSMEEAANKHEHESVKRSNDALLRDEDLENQARLLVKPKHAVLNGGTAVTRPTRPQQADQETRNGDDDEDEKDEDVAVIFDKGSKAKDQQQCRPLRDLSDNCLAVRENFALRMDQEAAELCDAHKICYACGATNDISLKQCDASFMLVSTKLCDLERRSGACAVETRGLLMAMQASHLTFGPTSMASRQLQCHQPCVSRFLKAVINMN